MTIRQDAAVLCRDLEDGTEGVRAGMLATAGDGGEIIGLRDVIESDVHLRVRIHVHPWRSQRMHVHAIHMPLLPLRLLQLHSPTFHLRCCC